MIPNLNNIANDVSLVQVIAYASIGVANARPVKVATGIAAMMSGERTAPNGTITSTKIAQTRVIRVAIQAICEILHYKEIELVAPLPRELGAWIDMSAAVSARTTHRDEAAAFIKYILGAEATRIWKTKGLERFN